MFLIFKNLNLYFISILKKNKFITIQISIISKFFSNLSETLSINSSVFKYLSFVKLFLLIISN